MSSSQRSLFTAHTPWGGDDPQSRLAALGPAPLALGELVELVLGARDATRRTRVASSELTTAFSSAQALAAATLEDLAVVVGPRRAAAIRGGRGTWAPRTGGRVNEATDHPRRDGRVPAAELGHTPPGPRTLSGPVAEREASGAAD